MSSTASSSSKKSTRVVALLGRLAALAAVYAFFAILTPAGKGFMSDANTQLMLQDIAVVAMAAIGMTIVIVAGGIDLSAGSSVALSMITTAYVLNLGPAEAKLVVAHPVALPLLAIAAAVGVSVLIGFINGARVAWLRIVPYTITLGTMQMAHGFA